MVYMLRAVAYGFAFSFGVALFKAAQSQVTDLMEEMKAPDEDDPEEMLPPPPPDE